MIIYFICFQFDDIIITKSVIQCALSKKHRNDDIVKKWCSQSKITTTLIDTARNIALDNVYNLRKNQNLILLSFEALEDSSKFMIFNLIIFINILLMHFINVYNNILLIYINNLYLIF